MVRVRVRVRDRVEVGKGDVTNSQNSQIIQLSYPNGHQPFMYDQQPCQQLYACVVVRYDTTITRYDTTITTII